MRDGPLSAPVTGAGAGHRKLQRALTTQRETVRQQHLDVAIRALPEDDMRRAAWVNLDRFSTTWVPVWPHDEAYLSNAEFLEVTATYFGLRSPACQPLVGQRLGSSRVLLDAYGTRLTTTPLPGDGWRTQHDALKWQISHDLQEMHVRATTEVYGLFAALIPQPARTRLDNQPKRKRQGMVPDFLVFAPEGPSQACLAELKTLHYGSSTYPTTARRCEAVQNRAGRIPGEYAAKARAIDTQYCGTAPGETGPVCRQLLSYGTVRGFVFGAWGEASGDVHDLLQLAAKQGARTRWRDMGCRDEAAAVGCLAWLLRRRWGLAALRENARLKLDRLAYVGRGAAAAADRRQRSELQHAARARFSRAHQWFSSHRR